MTLARVELVTAKPVEKDHNNVARLRHAERCARGRPVESAELVPQGIERGRDDAAQVVAFKVGRDETCRGEPPAKRHRRTPMTSCNTPAKSTSARTVSSIGVTGSNP